VKIYFVRHGQSEANANGIVADSTPGLTEAGIEQALKTGSELVNHGITLIVCSPYLRAQQTAEIIAGEIGVGIESIKIMDELRERGLGEKEAKPKVNENEWFFMADDEYGIEPRADLLRRMIVALKKIIEHKPAKGNILIVGHAISGFYLLQAAKGFSKLDELDNFHQMSNADYIEVEIRN
jgi:broad specificity phosphatase PhoE